MKITTSTFPILVGVLVNLALSLEAGLEPYREARQRVASLLT